MSPWADTTWSKFSNKKNFHNKGAQWQFPAVISPLIHHSDETKSTKPSPVCFGLAFLLKIYIPPLKHPPPKRKRRKKIHPAVTEWTCMVHHVGLLYMLIPDGSVAQMDTVNFKSLQVNFPVFPSCQESCQASMELNSSLEKEGNQLQIYYIWHII